MTINKADARRTIESLNAVGSPLERGVRATPHSPGLLETLETAARLLEADAQALKQAHTLRGKWPAEDDLARFAYEEIRAVAKRLRKARKYMTPNPLGGPAKVFDACADAIRAGDPIDEAMAAYGLAWRPNVGTKRSDAPAARPLE